jgi:hypothetical protein
MSTACRLPRRIPFQSFKLTLILIRCEAAFDIVRGRMRSGEHATAANEMCEANVRRETGSI